MTARTIWVLLLLPPGQVKVFVDERVGRLEGQVDLGTEMLALTTRDAAWPYRLQVG